MHLEIVPNCTWLSVQVTFFWKEAFVFQWTALESCRCSTGVRLFFFLCKTMMKQTYNSHRSDDNKNHHRVFSFENILNDRIIALTIVFYLNSGGCWYGPCWIRVKGINGFKRTPHFFSLPLQLNSRSKKRNQDWFSFLSFFFLKMDFFSPDQQRKELYSIQLSFLRLCKAVANEPLAMWEV